MDYDWIEKTISNSKTVKIKVKISHSIRKLKLVLSKVYSNLISNPRGGFPAPEAENDYKEKS